MPLYSLQKLENEINQERTSDSQIMGSIANELVKSYGFRRDDQGDWSWSVANIGKAYQEDPFWTFLDHATLALGPAKFGVAAARIAKAGKAIKEGKELSKFARGAGLVGRMYAGGEFAAKAGERGSTWVGRTFQALGGSGELRAATEARLAGPGMLHAVRIPRKEKSISLANPITTQISDEYLGAIDRYGGVDALEEWERRAITSSHKREKIMAEHAVGYEAQQLRGQVQSLGNSARGRYQQQRLFRLMAEGVKPGDDLVKSTFGGDAAAMEVYQNTWKLRSSIHEKMYSTGLIDKEQYLQGLDRYVPRLYEEWLDVHESLRGIGGTGRLPAQYAGVGNRTNILKQAFEREEKGIPKLIAKLRDAEESGNQIRVKTIKDELRRAEARADAAKQAWDNHKPATEILKEGRVAKRMAERPIKGYTQVWNPDLLLGELARAGQAVARQEFALGLSKSVMARSLDDVGSSIMAAVASGKPERLLAAGVTSAKFDHLKALVSDLNDVNRVPVFEDVAEILGWKKIDDLYPGKPPGYIRALPKEFRNQYLDPAAATEIKGMIDQLGNNEHWMWQSYKRMMGYWRKSKTVYNPSTHVRNIFGASIFSHMATGDFGSVVPLLGLRASPSVRKVAAEYGVLSSTFETSLHKPIKEAADLAAQDALSWLPSGKVADTAKKMVGGMQDFYRGVDETYKLDAWIRLTNKFEKQGHKLDKARSLAKLEVDKFTPNFQMQSELTAAVNQAIPFYSFTAEALRVWKNVMSEKPHMAFFWNHVAASMSQVFGGIAGFSPEQLAEAQNQLPGYMHGKKTLMLPFRVDGQPHFLDLSYLIPMGNLSEMATTERSFFTELVDPTSNPVINMASAFTTGTDPFSGRELGPNFTERQLGIPVESPQARFHVGLFEHMAQTMSPPLAPWGYAGTNLIEAARGQKNPATGEVLEPPLRAILGNLAGMRAYPPNVEAQIRNVKDEQRKLGEMVSQAWDRWKFAHANGNTSAMQVEEDRIIRLKGVEGHDDPEGYFQDGLERRRRRFSELSTKQIEEMVSRARRLGTLSAKDRRLMGELMARLSERDDR